MANESTGTQLNTRIEATGFQPLRIGILEDSTLFMNVIGALLAEAGHHVVADCRTASEALDVFPCVDPDLLIVDINLPDGNGIDVARGLLGDLPDVRVTFLSDFSRPIALQGLSVSERRRVSYLLKSRLSSRRDFAQLILTTYTEATVDPSVSEPKELTVSQLDVTCRVDLELIDLMAMGTSEKRIAELLGTSRRDTRARMARLMRSEEASQDQTGRRPLRAPWRRSREPRMGMRREE